MSLKIVIFAGGTGRRLWPLSRQASPKQFEPIIGTKSTLRLAVERVLPTYGADNIFVSTNDRYRTLVADQLPELDDSHVIGEPARRDVAAAVGLSLAHLTALGHGSDPVAVLWGDNYMKNQETFALRLQAATDVVQNEYAKIAFLGESPRFANENLGWIGIGEQIGQSNDVPFFSFESWVYRPALDDAKRMFESGSHVWNTGYFVSSVNYLSDLYAANQPALWSQLSKIGSFIGTAEYGEALATIYPELPSIHFDDAISKHVMKEDAAVIHGDMGWSDPGTLYALKEALATDKSDNVVKGLVRISNLSDSLVYNFVDNKLLAAVGLDGVVIVNTEDAILVVHKDHIPLVKDLVNGFEGTELAKFS